ncbi:MAG: hypothetical protein JXA14_14135, partial [Anaerolineae bacterium]|nr:hypothetical protein [Anaerolineae bacterium]
MAVLNTGFAGNLLRLLFDLGEPAAVVEETFDPVATAARYPILIIPSGGLYGLEGSAVFRARLEEYARLGGTIVAFDQQHGYEYSALPGGQVGGYGWEEDLHCIRGSVSIEDWHPALSGFGPFQHRLSVRVDGYLTSWPENAQTLLSRSANGWPAMLTYPFGKGHVFATTMYDDWGTGRGQSTGAARVLLRDLITWAVAPEDVPQFDPGVPVALEIPVINTSAFTGTSVSLQLVDPARQVVLTRTVHVTIPVGASVSVPFTTAAPSTGGLGLWRVDARVLAANGYRLTERQQVTRYAVADPPRIVNPHRALRLSITAPAESFPRGQPATFTYHLYNYTQEPLTTTVYYGFNHDFDWRGIYRLLAEDVLVPAAEGETPGEVAVPLELTVNRPFRLRGHASAGDLKSNATFTVWTHRAEVSVAASVHPTLTRRADDAVLNVQVASLAGDPLTTTLHVRALDSRRMLFDVATLTVPLGGDETTEITHTLAIPRSVHDGTGQMWVEARSLDGRSLGGAVSPFSVYRSPLVFGTALPETLLPGATQAVTMTVANTSDTLAVTDGTLSLALIHPQGITETVDSIAFVVQPGETITRHFSFTTPQPRLGTYAFVFSASDEIGSHTWKARPSGDDYGTHLWQEPVESRVLLAAGFDQPTYRAGDPAHLDVTLANGGNFLETLDASVVAPDAAYSTTQSTVLLPVGQAIVTYTLSMPPDIAAGSHPVTVTVTQPSGSAVQQRLDFYVPPSRLSVVLAERTAVAGKGVTLTITNVGDARTWGTYEFALRDTGYRSLVDVADSVTVLGPDESQVVTFTVPDGATSGPYYLVGNTYDAQADEVRPFVSTVQVSGVETLLDVRTDRQTYAVDETIDVTAVVTNVGTVLEEGDLALQIVHRQPPGGQWPAWRVYDPDNSGLSSRWLRSVAVDNEGNVWFSKHDDYGGAETLEVLLADLETWVTYEMPLSVWQVSDIAVDGGNQKWFATDAGVARLSADNATWDTFTTANSDLVSDWVNSVAVDGDGNAWFGTEEGVSKLTPGGQWETYTTVNSDLVSDWVYVVAPDGQGNVWIGTDYGLNVITADGAWETYQESSGLLTPDVYDIAFDAGGNGWLLTPGYEGGISVLMSDGSWTSYTPDDSGLSSEYGMMAIVVDEAGRVWIGQDGYGVDVLLP